MSRSLQIKVCCISSVEEALLALHEGADALGFVSAMPSGPGIIDEGLIAEIVGTVSAGSATFLLTSETSADRIVAQHELCRTSTIQLCDALAPAEHEKLRAALPRVKLVQVVHVHGHETIAESQRQAPGVDALLLDSGNPYLNVKELGGTGRRHDWSISRAIVLGVHVPVFLAGGLNAANVGQAMAEVNPFGLDVCSGVRTDGALDPAKLREFIAAARSAQALQD